MTPGDDLINRSEGTFIYFDFMLVLSTVELLHSLASSGRLWPLLFLSGNFFMQKQRTNDKEPSIGTISSNLASCIN